MRKFIIGERQYRTDGRKSDISGRLLLVEYCNDLGMWKAVKNVSRREQIQAMLEAA